MSNIFLFKKFSLKWISIKTIKIKSFVFDALSLTYDNILTEL